MSKDKKERSYTYALVVTGARLNAQQRKWLADYAEDMVNPGGKAGVTREHSGDVEWKYDGTDDESIEVDSVTED